MALELEHRHAGQLGLRLVPVGLTFSAKDRYRSEVLVHFGEPIRVADFLSHDPEQRRECIQALTLEIERRIEALILHLPKLERARVVDAVKRLYLERLRVGNRVIHEPVSPQAGELLLTRAIASAVNYTFVSFVDLLLSLASADRFVRFLLPEAICRRWWLRSCESGDFGSLRLVMVGAEKLPERLAVAFEEKFGIEPVEGYGCTECSPVATGASGVDHSWCGTGRGSGCMRVRGARFRRSRARFCLCRSRRRRDGSPGHDSAWDPRNPWPERFESFDALVRFVARETVR